MGEDSHGQLGLGTTKVEYNTPQKVGNNSNWKYVSSGWEHSLAITDAGELYAWGWNYYGRLGLGSSSDIDIPRPQKVNGLQDVAYTETFLMHNVGIKKDGTIYGWGPDHFNQLGPNIDGTQDRPVALNISSIPMRNFPTDVRATIEEDVLKISWSPLPGVKAYEVYINKSLYDTTTEARYEIEGILPHTPYIIEVAAIYNDDVKSERSFPIQAMKTLSNGKYNCFPLHIGMNQCHKNLYVTVQDKVINLVSLSDLLLNGYDGVAMLWNQ